MRGDTLKERTARGLLWGGLSNGLMQVAGAAFGLVLMRLLTPNDWGRVYMLNIFAALACALQESGFIQALCNRREPSHEEYNAVFWFNLLVSAALYAALWLAAPLIAAFYGDPGLTALARFLFLGFLLSGLGTVQRAYLFGHLMVREASVCSLTAMGVSGCLGVAMAMRGFASWGIVAQQVTFVLLVQLLSWHYSPWRPTARVDLRPALRMFGFSGKLLATSLFTICNKEAFSVLLGKCFDNHTAGVYGTARKWDDMASGTINQMASGVAQPTLAQVAADAGRYRQVFRKMLRFVSLVTFPAMLGLGLVAREFILIAGGEKWRESGLLLALLCVHGASVPLTTLYSSLTVSRGRSGVNLACTVGQCLAVWAGLLLLYPRGMTCMVAYFVALNWAWLGVWQWWAKRLIGLRWRHAAMDSAPFLGLTLLALGLTWWATRGIGGLWWLLLSRVAMAAALYAGALWLSGARIARESAGFLLKRRTGG